MKMTLASFCLMLWAAFAAAADTTVAVSSGAAPGKTGRDHGKGVWNSTGTTGGVWRSSGTTPGVWRSSQTWVGVSSGTVAGPHRRHNPELMSGVTMKEGKMMLLMPGDEVIPLKNDWVTTDGTRVQMTGQVTTKAGKMSMFKEGDVILSDGTVKRKKGK